MIPDLAIIGYKHNHDSNEIFYLESGGFSELENGVYTMNSLRPLVDEEIVKLQTMIVDKKGIYVDGLLPENLIYFNPCPTTGIVMWYMKEQEIDFMYKDEVYPSKKYRIPNTMFLTVNKDIYVFLVKKKDMKNLSLKTELYHSHYLNIYGDDRLCIGNGYKPNYSYVGVNEMIEKVTESFFYKSYFTHPNTHFCDYGKVWKENNGIYPEKEWKKSCTIKSVLSKYTKVS
jgi:PRTRC genetic system protein B